MQSAKEKKPNQTRKQGTTSQTGTEQARHRNKLERPGSTKTKHTWAEWTQVRHIGRGTQSQKRETKENSKRRGERDVHVKIKQETQNETQGITKVT